MSKIQMSFIVRSNSKDDNTNELNELLNNGWLVVMTCPMNNHEFNNSALVILEKES